MRVGAEQADHVGLGDVLHIAAEATDVVGVFDGYSCDSAVASAFQAHFHRLVHHDLAKSPVPVEYGRRGRLTHDFDLGVGNDLSLFDGAYVLGDADDAVRVVPHCIGVGQQLGDDIGCRRWCAGCGENGCADLAQVFDGK